MDLSHDLHIKIASMSMDILEDFHGRTLFIGLLLLEDVFKVFYGYGTF